MSEQEQTKPIFKVGDRVQYIVTATIAEIEDIPGKAMVTDLAVNGEPQSYIDFSTGEYLPIAHLKPFLQGPSGEVSV